MRFLVTPDCDRFDKVICTDEYTQEEIANNRHIENIKEDIKSIGFNYPVRIYAIVGDRPPKNYTLLS